MKDMDFIVKSLRELLPEYMAQKRIVVGSTGKKKIRCINPEHEDSTPSMSYHPQSKQLHCFGCGKSYDIFDLIALDYSDCDSFPRQIKKGCEIFGFEFPEGGARFTDVRGGAKPEQEISLAAVSCPSTPALRAGGAASPPVAPPAAAPALRAGGAASPPVAPPAAAAVRSPAYAAPPPPAAAPNPAHSPALRAGEITPSPPTLEAQPQPPDHTLYIQEQLTRYKPGGDYFNVRGISQSLCEKYRLYQTADRAILPVYRGTRCVSWSGRSLSDALEPRYKNSVGASALWGADYFDGEGLGGALFVTESVFDALSAEECGFHAIALCGAGNVRKFLSLCAGRPIAANRYTIIAAGDNDAAGERMNAALADGLAGLGITCQKLILPEKIKDLNEYLISGREGLRELLSEAAQGDGCEYALGSAANGVNELLDAAQRRSSRDAISTGFPALNRVLDGGLYSGLYIIGAISSLGKTSYVLQIADAIAASGHDVLFFSLEMSKIELMAKSISRLTYQLDPSADRRDAFTARQALRLDIGENPARGRLFALALERYKTDAAGLFFTEGIMEIGTAEIRKAVHRHVELRRRPPVVIVDYLQILRPADMRATDKQNTDRSVVELKRISRDFDIPVVAVSSFNRENYRNAVSMEAFKESGAVEYSSDVLLGMQLSGAGGQNFDVNAAKERSPRAVELVMLKNRSGAPYAKLEYAYIARHSCFGESRG